MLKAIVVSVGQQRAGVRAGQVLADGLEATGKVSVKTLTVANADQGIAEHILTALQHHGWLGPEQPDGILLNVPGWGRGTRGFNLEAATNVIGIRDRLALALNETVPVFVVHMGSESGAFEIAPRSWKASSVIEIRKPTSEDRGFATLLTALGLKSSGTFDVALGAHFPLSVALDLFLANESGVVENFEESMASHGPDVVRAFRQLAQSSTPRTSSVATIFAASDVDPELIARLASAINDVHLALGGGPLQIREDGMGIFNREGVPA